MTADMEHKIIITVKRFEGNDAKTDRQLERAIRDALQNTFMVDYGNVRVFCDTFYGDKHPDVPKK